MSRKLEALGAGLSALLGIFFFAAPVLPVVMQDEYVYRRQTALFEFADYQYPTYLFSLIARIGEQFGEVFYLWVKFQNSLVAAIACGVLYWVFTSLHSRLIGAAAAASFLVFPALFQSSFYMPDLFLSAFLAISLSLAILGVSKEWGARHPIWLLSGLALGLALLSKPHALILVAAFGLFIAIELLLRRKFPPLWIAILVGLTIRLSVGFFLAGAAGLNIFGLSYSQSFTSQSAGDASNSFASSAGAGSSLPGNFFLAYLVESLQLLAVIGFVSLGLFFVLLMKLRQNPVNQLVLITVLVGVLAIGLFETWLVFQGDDHSVRILTRHLEFLVPIVVGAGLIELSGFVIKKVNWLWVVGPAAALLIVANLFLSNLPRKRISDGTAVILSNLWGGGWLLAGSGLFVAFWIGWLVSSRTTAVLGAAGLMLVSFAGAMEVRAGFSNENSVDFFGKALASSGQFKKDSALILATSKASAEAFLFYTLLENAEFRVASRTDQGIDTEVFSGKMVFPVGLEINLDCPAGELEGFQYFDCRGIGG